MTSTLTPPDQRPPKVRRKQAATKQTTLWPIAGRGQHAETAHGAQKPGECMPYLLHHRRLDLDRRHPAHDALVTGRDVFLQHPLRHVIAVQPPPPTAMGRRQRPPSTPKISPFSSAGA